MADVEDEAARTQRRAMSSWLTKAINTLKPLNPLDTENRVKTVAIRKVVLQALAEIHNRIAQLNRSICEIHHLHPDRKLVVFYLKGGNAFECVKDPNGESAMTKGGGDSDWDTQIVIDPWAPEPLQAYIYGRVEDLVTDTLMEAGVLIAEVAGGFAKKVGERWDEYHVQNNSPYLLTFDTPQTFRLVYDQQRLGLWTNTRRPLSSKDADHPERIPGIILNDSIEPFILYRLGYTWHAEIDPDVMVDQQPVEVKKPVLMELIDVTIPRRNTIEAVAVWEELTREHVKVQDRPVAVNMLGYQRHQYGCNIPFPDMMYHLREIATMLCEIADGSSHHADKLGRRFERFAIICRLGNEGQIIKTLSEMAGVQDLRAVPRVHEDSVTTSIQRYGGSLAAHILADTDSSFIAARTLMDVIARGAVNRQTSFSDGTSISGAALQSFAAARGFLREMVEAATRALPALIPADVAHHAYSDDLVLMRSLERNGYLLPQKIGFSGVFAAVVIRVQTAQQLAAVRDLLVNSLGDGMSASRRTSDVARLTGFSHECNMVIFDHGAARFFITITTATDGEAPIRMDAIDQVPFASLSEIALQRKVAAAMTEDYLVRAALSRQYEALKILLPVK